MRRDAPHKSLTKADAAYSEIRARILACDLAPGSVVDQELIAEWLDSSTTPVREALRRLDAEGLVSLRAHTDVRVAPVSIEEFREFHTIRLGLEPIAAEQTAMVASEAQIESIRQAREASASQPDSVELELDRSRLFHRAIYSAAGNRTMTEILDSIWDRAGRYRVIFARAGSIPTCQSPEHLQIVEAISERDSQLVGELMRSDLDATFQQIMSIAPAALQSYV